MPPPGRFDFDWRRISRWCLLGTLVMLLWLLAPVVKCGWGAFRDTPISELQPTAGPADADRERVEEGAGFWSKFGTSVKQCYRQAPLTGQEPWKSNLLFGFGAATLIAWLLDRILARRRRTFT